MKVYLNKYKYHWISPYTIVDYMFFWTAWAKCSRKKEFVPDEEWVETPEWAEQLARRIEPVSYVIQWVWDKLDRKIDYVKIDRWDYWSVDHTLSRIIAPLLKEMRANKQSYGWIDDKDVPEELRSTAPGARDGLQEWDWDHNAEARYNWVIDEMIWAFEVGADNDYESQFYDHTESNKIADLNESIKALKVDRAGLKAYEKRKANGYRLFGKYYESLWT
jgi:hypothetical protein